MEIFRKRDKFVEEVFKELGSALKYTVLLPARDQRRQSYITNGMRHVYTF